MMDTRELLTKAIVGVIKQGRPSRDSGFCVYRSPEGLKCAVGHLIEAAHYNTSLEGASIRSDKDVVHAVEQSIGRKLGDRELFFLETMQRCHDDTDEDDFVDNFVNKIGNYVSTNSLPNYCLEIIAEAQK